MAIRRLGLVWPLAVAAALAMLVISEGAYRQSVKALDELVAIGDARGDILQIEQSVLVAEAGQRGYLLTNRPEYLLPYTQALVDTAESFRRLERYHAPHPDTLQGLRALQALTDAKLAALAEAIRLHDGGSGAARTDMVLSAQHKQQMDAIRVHVVALLSAQVGQADAGRAALHDTLSGRRVGMALLTALCLLALYLFVRRTDELKQHEQRLGDVVQTERDRLEVEVGLRTAQLTELTRHLQTAREDERNRLARNLHDELGSLLTSAKLDAARIKSRLADKAPEALERLAHLVQTLNQSIALGRSIIEDLRPSTLGNLGLVPTLDILAREFADQSATPVVCDLQPVSLSASAELVVYRLVQEAITNISKYAAARHVWISLGASEGVVTVSVRDDGVGFDMAVPAKSAFGLLGMRFRVESEGGSLVLASAPGEGTLVTVRLPESMADADADADAISVGTNPGQLESPTQRQKTPG